MCEKQVFQDGSEFYLEGSGELVASYPALVKDDFDLDGAIQARRHFVLDHPYEEYHYKLI